MFDQNQLNQAVSVFHFTSNVSTAKIRKSQAGHRERHASVSLGCKGSNTGLAIRENHQVQLKHISGATCEETQAETQPSQTFI
jgi:hypothetical protein